MTCSQQGDAGFPSCGIRRSRASVQRVAASLLAIRRSPPSLLHRLSERVFSGGFAVPRAADQQLRRFALSGGPKHGGSACSRRADRVLRRVPFGPRLRLGELRSVPFLFVACGFGDQLFASSLHVPSVQRLRLVFLHGRRVDLYGQKGVASAHLLLRTGDSRWSRSLLPAARGHACLSERARSVLCERAGDDDCSFAQQSLFHDEGRASSAVFSVASSKRAEHARHCRHVFVSEQSIAAVAVPCFLSSFGDPSGNDRLVVLCRVVRLFQCSPSLLSTGFCLLANRTPPRATATESIFVFRIPRRSTSSSSAT